MPCSLYKLGNRDSTSTTPQEAYDAGICDDTDQLISVYIDNNFVWGVDTNDFLYNEAGCSTLNTVTFGFYMVTAGVAGYFIYTNGLGEFWAYACGDYTTTTTGTGTTTTGGPPTSSTTTTTTGTTTTGTTTTVTTTTGTTTTTTTTTTEEPDDMLTETIAYNELQQAFTSFYDFKPRIYFKVQKKFLSSVDRKVPWAHNVGEYGDFYGTKYPSYVTMLINPNGMVNMYNNYEMFFEVYDENEDDVSNEAFHQLTLWNDHQASGDVDMTDTGALVYTANDDLLKRRVRKWRFADPRDTDGNRMWSNYLLAKILYTNHDDYRIIMHNLETYYQTHEM